MPPNLGPGCACTVRAVCLVSFIASPSVGLIGYVVRGVYLSYKSYYISFQAICQETKFRKLSCKIINNMI